MVAPSSPQNHPEEPSPWDPIKESLPNDLAGFIAARVELASIEAKEAAEFAANKATNGIVLATCAFFTWSLFLAGLTGLLAPFASRWLEGKIDALPGWAAVLFALAILHGLGALICLGQLKKKTASPLFELSRKEFEHDKQWLTKNK
jgi:uncharacterized membrane protein YqjE